MTDSLDKLKQTETENLDHGKVNETFFIQCCILGYDCNTIVQFYKKNNFKHVWSIVVILIVE